MNINEILKHLPHRYPFLLLDRVLTLEPGKSIHAYKNVTVNEPFFTGHFPHYPVMPGVLIVEALAQAAGVLSFKTAGEMPTDDSLFFFVGIDDARFKKQVIPGDQLHLHVEILRQMRGIWKY
ncbi:MAG: 3-hydroxyacyl-ACP dehydratase FabZ, partial [Azovibrio sp.]